MKTKIKSISTRGVLAALVGVGLAVSGSAQTVDYTQGDLLLGFRATGGTGADVNLIYNVGATWDFRDQKANAVGHIANLGDALADTYGADWFTRNDLHVGLVGVYTNGNPDSFIGAPTPVNGDPGSTLYLSQVGNPPTLGNTGSVVNAATSFQSFQGLFASRSALAGTDNKGALISAATEQSWSYYNGTFSTGPGLEYTFGLHAEDDSLSINLYRLLATNTGADPQGTLRGGDLVTTFTIDSLGNISAVPEPSTYALIFGAGVLAFASVRRLRSRKTAAIL